MGSSTRLVPRRRRASARHVPASGDLREELLVATREILREEGLAFVSLRAVARRANVSHGAPAYHFGNKSGLLTAFAARGYRLLVRDVEARLAHTGPDAREQLQAIGRAYVAFAVAHPETFAIMFRGELHERGNDELAKASDAAIELLGGTIRRGVAQGYVSPEAAPTAAAAAWSIAHGIADLWIQGRLQARTNERDSDKLATAVLGLFVSSIMPERVVPPAKRRR